MKSTADYRQDFQYENGTLQFIAQPEGYIYKDATGYRYVYQYKDHLGNNRLSFMRNAGTTAIVKETNYYPFGLTHRGYNNLTTSLGSAGAKKYQYNGKLERSGNPALAGELQEDFGLDWYDYGARFYDAGLGRFMVQDVFAEKYVSMSPYQYAANNPVNLIDINGDSISVNITLGGGQDGRNLYQIHVTGKVVDNTSKGLSEKQLNRIAKKISKQVANSFSGKDKNIEYEATADISVASEDNPLNKSDHAIRIIDDIATATGQKDPKGKNIEGYGTAGQKVVYLEKGTNYSRTGAHELGHSFGLSHIKDEIEITPSNKFIPLTVNDYPGNLMHQSQDVNSQGKSVAGTSIAPFQIRKIYRLYKVGALNKGKQR
jgi:RHS repeat-associated protein